MFFKKKPDLEQINMLGTLILFILQNNFFLNLNENLNDNVADIDDCITSYIGEDSYSRFINKHKKLENPLLDGNESIAYYASNLIPPEPEIYPMTVKDAQNKYPHLLLDVVTLEAQYFFSVAVIMMINKHFKNKGQHFLPSFITLFHAFAGWSENGVEKAWEHGLKRCNKYIDLLNLDQTRFGVLAAKNIFNTYNIIASLNISMNFASSIEAYSDVLKNLK